MFAFRQALSFLCIEHDCGHGRSADGPIGSAPMGVRSARDRTFGCLRRSEAYIEHCNDLMRARFGLAARASVHRYPLSPPPLASLVVIAAITFVFTLVPLTAINLGESAGHRFAAQI